MAQSKPDGHLKPHWFQILLTLADRECHGLEIMDDVSSRTDGRIHLWPGMLYGALKRMTADGLVTERKPPAGGESRGGRPRYYGSTDAGRRACASHARQLERFVGEARAKKLLEGRST